MFLLKEAIASCLWHFYTQESQIYYTLYYHLHNGAGTVKDSIDILKEYILAYPHAVPIVADLSWKYFLNKDIESFIKYATYGYQNDTSHNHGIILNYGHTFVFKNDPDSAIYYYKEAISRYPLYSVSALRDDFKKFNNLYPAHHEIITEISTKLFQ